MRMILYYCHKCNRPWGILIGEDNKHYYNQKPERRVEGHCYCGEKFK